MREELEMEPETVVWTGVWPADGATKAELIEALYALMRASERQNALNEERNQDRLAALQALPDGPVSMAIRRAIGVRRE